MVTARPRLELKQRTALKVAPTIAQKAQTSLKVLAMSRQDLSTLIATELEQNPFLEEVRVEEGRLEESRVEERRAEAGHAESTDPVERIDGYHLHSEDYDSSGVEDGSPRQLEASTQALSSTWSTLASKTGRNQSDPYASEGNGVDERIENPQSLYQHLYEQLGYLVEASDRHVAESLLGMLDEKGRLSESIADLASRLGVDEGRLERVVDLLQRAEPTGVFARDLIDCFRLQLKEREGLSDPMERLLQNLPLLAQGKLDELAEVCGCDRSGLMPLVTTLKSLDHNPCRQFGGQSIQMMVPDVYVYQNKDGTLWVELNESVYPQLSANKGYYQRVVNHQSVARIAEQCQAMKSKYETAIDLVTSIERRGRTLLRVMETIVTLQQDFFRYGIDHLKPLVLNDIAVELDLAESTISRTCANKFASTPRGNLPMKYFFGSSVANAQGEQSVSANTVKHRIKVMIQAEDKDRPLSDHTLQVSLQQEGIVLARRTVTKYREAMLIPSSVARRRQYKLDQNLARV